MNDRDIDELLTELLAQDLSAGTEEFREALLARCLAIVNAGGSAQLDDANLELIAAAGNMVAPEDAMPRAGAPSTDAPPCTHAPERNEAVQ